MLDRRLHPVGFSGAPETFGIPIAASVAELSNHVTFSYTPTFSARYSVSAPAGATRKSGGFKASLAMDIAPWSDFPVNRQLYCM